MTAPLLVRRFLEDDLQQQLSAMLHRIQRRYDRNDQLWDWYHGKELVQSLGIAVSAQFDELETVLGWPGTVVDKLIKRRTVDHIEVAGSPELQAQVDDIWETNELALESRMLHIGKAVTGIHFTVAAKNGIVLPTPSTRMTCDYDRATRTTLAAASWDAPREANGERQATLYLPDRTIVVEPHGGRYLVVAEYKNPAGRVPVERFVNRPTDGRPWGSSNITPAVLSYTKRSVRTLMAMEVAREFFAAPQRYALDIDPDAFTDEDGNKVSKWETYMGKFIALMGADGDEDGVRREPKLGQLPASSPTPLIDMVKMDSQLLSTEVGMPPSMFGFVTDNPPSGDGQRMFESDLVLTAETDNTTDSVPWKRTIQLGLIGRGVPADQIPPIKVIWKNPATFMPAAATDAVAKQVQAQILPPDSVVALERLGYDRTEVLRIIDDRRMARAQSVVAGLAERAAAARTNPAVPAVEARRADAAAAV